MTYEHDYYDYFPEIAVRRGGIQYPTRGTQVIKTKEELTKERERLAAELTRVEEKIDSRNRYGDDPFKNGDMLKIMMTFPTGGGSYTYAAVKARGRYYLTGRVQTTRTFLGEDDTAVRNGWSYEQFISWLASSEDARVWRVKAIERIF